MIRVQVGRRKYVENTLSRPTQQQAGDRHTKTVRIYWITERLTD